MEPKRSCRKWMEIRVILVFGVLFIVLLLAPANKKQSNYSLKQKTNKILYLSGTSCGMFLFQKPKSFHPISHFIHFFSGLRFCLGLKKCTLWRVFLSLERFSKASNLRSINISFLWLRCICWWIFVITAFNRFISNWLKGPRITIQANNPSSCAVIAI